MSGVDISVLITLACFGAIGAWKGFSWQATHLASVTCGFTLATAVAPPLARAAGEPSPFGRCLAWLAVFALAILLGYLLAYRLKEKIAEYKLKAFDREFGAVLGVMKGGLLTSIVLFFLAVPPDGMRDEILDSHAGGPFALVLERFHRYIPEDLHEDVHPKDSPAGPGHWGGEEQEGRSPPSGR